MTQNAYTEEDPRYQTAKIKEQLHDLSKQARENVERVNDVRAKVLLKATADLISNLTSVYEEYESKRNPVRAPTQASRKSAWDNAPRPARTAWRAIQTPLGRR